MHPPGSTHQRGEPLRWEGVIGGNAAPVVAGGLLAVATLATFPTLPPSPLGLALALVLCALTAVSGRWPMLVGVGICALLTAGVFLPEGLPLSSLGFLVPVAVAGTQGLIPLRRLLSLWGLLALGADVLLRSDALGQPGLIPGVASTLVFYTVLVLAAWLVGDALRLEHSRRRDSQRAALSHVRRDIAQDLHDTVAYSLSVIAIRADQARLKGTTTVDDLTFIAANSRQAIADLRGMMTMLRRDAEGTPETPTWLVEGLSDVLDRKSAELREAGFDVTATLEGDLALLPRSITETLAKVLHEALSNVRQHAMPRSGCAVLLTVGASEVELAVLSEVAENARARPDRLGILGMEERVGGLGGTFEAGRFGRHWAVRAAIPLTP